MAEFIFDASAVLAIAFDEPGADIVISKLSGAIIVSVNYSEAGAKLIDKGFGAEEAFRWLDALRLEIMPFDRTLAQQAAGLGMVTKQKKLSFADRACLALAIARGATAFTADRDWSKIDLPCPVELIR